MPEQPMTLYRNLDPEFAGLVHDAGELALADGALPRKTKLLIAMLFDAEHGATEGVQALARQALQAGATRQEILEALRVAEYLCGVGCLFTAAKALEGVLP